MLPAEGHRFMRDQIEGGRSVPLDVHDVPQFGVVIPGGGVYRPVLRVERRGRSTTKATKFPVRAGDGDYIPGAAPHSFSAMRGRPAVLVDIMVADPMSTAEGAGRRGDSHRAVSRRP